MTQRTPTGRSLTGPGALLALAGALFAGALFTGAAQGQEGGLTLGECVTIALEENPLLLSAREQYEASLARI